MKVQGNEGEASKEIILILIPWIKTRIKTIKSHLGKTGQREGKGKKETC